MVSISSTRAEFSILTDGSLGAHPGDSSTSVLTVLQYLLSLHLLLILNTCFSGWDEESHRPCNTAVTIIYIYIYKYIDTILFRAAGEIMPVLCTCSLSRVRPSHLPISIYGYNITHSVFRFLFKKVSIKKILCVTPTLTPVQNSAANTRKVVVCMYCM